MPDESSGYGPPKLNSYSAEFVQQHLGATRDAAPRQVCVTLHGENFMERAMMLMVQIGDSWVQRMQIRDPQTVDCFLDELPEDGARIMACYSGEEPVAMEELFSRSKMISGDEKAES